MIRSLVESSVRFRSLVIAVAAIVMYFGFTRLKSMPVDVFPEILPVTVNVQTEALGLSAAEVEQLITVPMEADLLAGTPWVEVMRSESVPGLSSIELTFKPGTDPLRARQVVGERLVQAHVALPNVSKAPQMLQPLSSTNRVMMIGVSSKTKSPIETSVLARWTIRPRLLGIPGVANVSIWGQRERQLQVQVDPARLRDKNVTLIDIIKTAGNALWFSPLTFLESSVAGTGGFVETPNQRLGVRHVLPINTAADLAKIPVEGTTVRLDQVATVIEDHQPLIGDAMNGEGPGLLLVVEKLPHVNTLKLTRDIEAALDQLKPGLPGIDFDSKVYSPAGYIQNTVGNVGLALLIALILVAIALFTLTRGWRAALVGLIAIPASLLAAVGVLSLAGATLNAMMVAGLVIALAVVIDDAIGDVHHFMRRMGPEQNGSRIRLLAESWAERRRPLIFVTAIVLLAALPLVFVGGVAGAFVKPMVLAYAVAVLASLVVATIVTPALSLVLLRPQSAPSGIFRRQPEVARTRSAGMPRIAIALAVILAVAGLALLPLLQWTPAPTFKEPHLMVSWTAIPGTSRAEMNRLIDRVNRELRTVEGVRNVGAHVGRAVLADKVVGINSGELWVSLNPSADYHATVAAVENIVAGYPGIDAHVMTYLRSRFSEALADVDHPVVVRVYGQDPEVIKREAEKVRQALVKIPGVVDPRVELQPEEPVVEVEVDIQAAQAHGIKPGEVRRAAATLLAGVEVGNLYEEQKLFQVVVWGEPHVRHSMAAINNLLIDGPDGATVRLGDVAKVQIVSQPQNIRRENVSRRLDVQADVSGRSIDAVTADVRNRVQQLSFPLEYRAEVMGEYAAQQRSRSQVLFVAIGVVLGILVLLQAAFRSWRLATAVLVTLPLALAGCAIGAFFMGAEMSLGSLAGFLTVFGFAVRNAMLSVQRYQTLQEDEGFEFGPELLRRGTADRQPTIVLGAIVMAAAMLPFAVLQNRAGLEILGPLSIVILGGLVTATLYTLYVVPALYARLGDGALDEFKDDEDLDLAV